MAARRPIALTWNWCRSSHLSRLVTAAPSSIGSRQIEQQGFSLSSRGKANRGVHCAQSKKCEKRCVSYEGVQYNHPSHIGHPPQLHPSPLVCPPPSPLCTHVEIDSESSPHRSARDPLHRLDPRPSRINKGLPSPGAALSWRCRHTKPQSSILLRRTDSVPVTTHYPVSSRAGGVYLGHRG